MGPAQRRLVIKMARIRIPVIGYIRHERGGVERVDPHFRTIDIAVGGQRSTPSGMLDVMPEEETVETIEKTVYRIPETSFADLEKKFAALNKKADKLGVPRVSFTDTGTETMLLVERDNLFDLIERGYDLGTSYEVTPEQLETMEEKAAAGTAAAPRVVGSRTYHLVTVEGEAPKLNGWTFRGTVMHAGEAGNMLRTVPGVEDVPEIYRTRDAHCDWCGLDRQRKDTFLVENDAGEWKQVGSNCLRDFLGHDSPEAVARWAEWLSGLDADMRGYEERDGGVGGEDRLYLQRFLPMVAAAIRTEGWLSRGKARDQGGVATADRALQAYYPRTREDELEVTDQDIEDAEMALTWVRDLPDEEVTSNDFMWNLHVATGDEFTPTRAAGVAAAVFIAKKFRDEKELERQKKVREFLDEWFGTPKKREDFELTVVFTKVVDGYYGSKLMVKFRDPEGREAIWWNSGDNWGEQITPTAENDWQTGFIPAWKEGETYKVKATVKAHDTYEGRKQTTLTRVVKLDK
jgi:hypothetical protein